MPKQQQQQRHPTTTNLRLKTTTTTAKRKTTTTVAVQAKQMGFLREEIQSRRMETKMRRTKIQAEKGKSYFILFRN
jgi:hypothetical protein